MIMDMKCPKRLSSDEGVILSRQILVLNGLAYGIYIWEFAVFPKSLQGTWKLRVYRGVIS